MTTHAGHPALAPASLSPELATALALDAGYKVAAPPPATSDSWTNTAGGNWSTAANWSAGAAPAAATDATIAAVGTYTVTISSVASAHSLTIDDVGATVTDTGTLTIGTTLAVTAGTFLLETGGSLVGGTISTASTGMFEAAGGTLNAVTCDGALSVTGMVNVVDGIGFTGTGDKVTIDTGGTLLFQDAASLSNAAFVLGGGALAFADTAGHNETLTLAGGVRIDAYKAIGGHDLVDLLGAANATLTLVNTGIMDSQQLGSLMIVEDNGYGDFINQGVIAAHYGKIEVATAGFTNAGTIEVDSGGEVNVLGAWTNTGTIEVSASGAVNLMAPGTNTGQIDVGANGTLGLGGSLTTAALLAELAHVTNTGGTIAIRGALDNHGARLDDTAGTFALIGGTISGGVISTGSNSLAVRTATLNQVTVHGTLNASGKITFENAINFDGGTGTGTSTVNGSNGAVLVFENIATLSNVAFDMNQGTIEFVETTGHSETLTLASNVSITDESDATLTITEKGYTDFVNQGLIADIANGRGTSALNLLAANFTNAGTLEVQTESGSSGTPLTVHAAQIVNDGLIEAYNWTSMSLYGSLLNAGLITVSGGSTIDIFGDCTNTATISIGNGGVLNLDGSWANTGQIDVAAGGVVGLTGSFTTATLLSEIAEFSNAGGTFRILGALDNAGTTLDVGTIALDGGTIVGGTLASGPAGTFSATGTLNGVTCQGHIDVTNGTLSVSNGFHFSSAGGNGRAVVDISSFGTCDLYNPLLLSDVIFDILASSQLGLIDNHAANETVTLAASTTIDASSIYYPSIVSLSGALDATLTLLNAGTIDASGNGSGAADLLITDNGYGSFINRGLIHGVSSFIDIDTQSFTNAGTIECSGTSNSAARLGLELSAGWTNTGTIDVSGTDNALILNETGDNTGKIDVSAGATLAVGDDPNYTLTTAGFLAELGQVSHSGATIGIYCALENAGATLSAGGAIGPVLQLGSLAVAPDPVRPDTIEGGTLLAVDGAVICNDSTWIGVAYQGTFDVAGLLTLDGTSNEAAASAPSVFNVIGLTASLIFDGDATIDNATVNIGAMSDEANEIATLGDIGGILTLGSHLDVVETTGSAIIGAGDGIGGNGAIVNQGTITADVAGAAIYLETSYFSNQGTVLATGGGAIHVLNETKFVHGVLSGGTWEASAASTIFFGDTKTSPAIITDAATIILSGGGSTIEVTDGPGYPVNDLEQTLESIAAAGTLALLASRDCTTTNAISDAGLLTLGGGTFSAPYLLVTAGGTLSGFGTVTAPVIDTTKATIEATAGTLAFVGTVTNDGTITATGLATFTDTVAGTGTLQIGATGTLTLEQGAVTTQLLDFLAPTGLLTLAEPIAFGAKIANFAPGNQIDLLNTAETNFSYATGTLTVKDNGTTVAALHFTGTYNQADFIVGSDGHGGTSITYT
jgi:hypothetical protein